eukprot:3190902-Prymnesium_polylepis.3
MRLTSSCSRPKGASRRASCSACSGASLTLSMSASSTMSRRSRTGRGASASMNASRSCSIEWAVVGTRSLRRASSAAWTDHASLQGSSAAALAMSAGDGPTVDTQTERRESANARGCTSISTATRTASKLLSGSPIPMKTTFTSFGSSRSRISRCASHTCERISSARRLRTSPIAPVEQNVQPREQPTCDEMHRV